jgi:hypothetical protein
MQEGFEETCDRKEAGAPFIGVGRKLRHQTELTRMTVEHMLMPLKASVPSPNCVNWWRINRVATCFHYG